MHQLIEAEVHTLSNAEGPGPGTGPRKLQYTPEVSPSYTGGLRRWLSNLLVTSGESAIGNRAEGGGATQLSLNLHVGLN